MFKKKKYHDIVGSTFLQLMIAQLMSFMAQIVAQVVDSMSISRFLSVDDLSAFSFSSSITSVVMMVFGLLMTGVSIYSAAMAKENNTDSRTTCFSTAIISALVFGIIMTAVYIPGSRWLAVLSGAPSELAGRTSDYILGYSVGIIPFLLFGASVPFTIIEGKRSIMKQAFLMMAVVDVILDIINGLVIHGGILGMGLATAISEYAAFFVVLFGYLRGKGSRTQGRNFHFSPSHFRFGALGEIFSYGYMYVLKQLLVTVLVYVYNNFITYRYGTTVLGIYAATYSAVSFAWCIGSAIGNTTASLTGLYANENDIDSLKRLIRISVYYSVIINGIVMLIFIFASRQIMGIFYSEQNEYTALSSVGLVLISLSMIIRSINMVVRSYYQAMKMNRFNIFMSVMDTLACEVAALVILSLICGKYGIWLSYPVGEAAALLIMMLYMRFKNGNKLRFAVLFPFPESQKIKAKFSAVLKNEENVMQWSVKIQDFCKENGADAGTAGKISLAVEEIGNNILKYGFSDGKAHAVDLLLKLTEEEWILRFRDDCAAFDPLGYLKMAEASSEHLGLKMVSALNDGISYINVMGTNNLVIRYKP